MALTCFRRARALALGKQIRRAGYKAPTPIQAQSWPVALQGRDMVAIAKTGSGKTCGFLLPGFLHCNQTRKDPRAGPTMLVIAPTRELAVQIKEEADKFGRSAGITNTCAPTTARAGLRAARGCFQLGAGNGCRLLEGGASFATFAKSFEHRLRKDVHLQVRIVRVSSVVRKFIGGLQSGRELY